MIWTLHEWGQVRIRVRPIQEAPMDWSRRAVH